MDELAQQHYQNGVEMYSARRYDEARIEFEASYKLLPLPDLLHNLSMVAEQQGHLTEAVDFEERFSAAATNLMHAERAETKARIAKLRGQAGMPPAPPSSTTEGTAGATEHRSTPMGALALIGIGGGMLLTGIGCGIGAFVTQKNLENGQPLYLREIDAMTSRGQALNAAGISFDVVGGVALVAGSAWAIVARTRGAKK